MVTHDRSLAQRVNRMLRMTDGQISLLGLEGENNMLPSDPMPFRQLHYSPPDRCSEDALIIMSTSSRHSKPLKVNLPHLKVSPHASTPESL